MISKSLRTKNKIKSYRKRILKYSGISAYRLDNLIKTINLFKEHGEVYLVRIPVIDGMLEIEDQLVQDFDKKMAEVAKNYQIPYINMTLFHEDYDYTDGNHLTVASGEKFSINLAKQMEKLRKK